MLPSGSFLRLAIRSACLHGSARTVLRCSFPVQPCTHGCEKLGHVTNQVIVNLGGVNHHQFPIVSFQRSVDVFTTEAGETITVLNDNAGGGLVAQECEELPSVTVQRRTYFGHHIIHSPPLGCAPCGYAGHLTVEVGLLVRG